MKQYDEIRFIWPQYEFTFCRETLPHLFNGTRSVVIELLRVYMLDHPIHGEFMRKGVTPWIAAIKYKTK